MEAIYKRELKGFFTNPVGYVFIAVMLAFEGFSFWQMMYYQSTQYFSVIYDNIFSFGMMLIPILTMKLFSEEKKQKTDQALLTAPVSLTGLVMGKFMAAVTVYAIPVLFTLVQAFVLSFIAVPNWAMIFGNVTGTLLYGSAMIAIGILRLDTYNAYLLTGIALLAAMPIIARLIEYRANCVRIPARIAGMSNTV
jgi:ABC-2 type transport system permease protein